MSGTKDAYRFDQIEALRRACGSDSRLSAKDIAFGSSLCDQYFSRTYLSEKQWYWVGELLKRAGAMPGNEGSSAPAADKVEEIFDGKKISALFVKASSKLKFPRLRYQTDGGSKIVFSFVADSASKWNGCCFISNGQRAENKKRYGFISRHGAGNLDRDANQEIKTLIRKIAADPTGLAKLQGQAYSNCCFCGLELTNKSSIHHGYGPICAENWGLPWGSIPGAEQDEKEAAKAELNHIELQDFYHSVSCPKI